MKAQDLMLAWSQNINDIGGLLDHKEDLINALIDFNFIKNGGSKSINMNSTIITDRSIYTKYLNGFEKTYRKFPAVINDTIYGHYSNIKDNRNKLYNVICYALMMRDIERMSTDDSTKQVIKTKLKYGFVDVIERMYQLDEELSSLCNKVYLNYKEKMDDIYYLSNIEDTLKSTKGSEFQIFLTIKAKLRSFIMMDICENYHNIFIKGTSTFYDDMIVLSAYFSEVLSINYLSKMEITVSDNKLLSDFYFKDITQLYSYEVVG